LQKVRLPNLTKAEFLYLFEVWRDRYRARQAINAAERDARFAPLCDERETLFKSIAAGLQPQERAAVTARLMEIGRELAILVLARSV
jgi:hypothetical protein